jgi:CRP/FNR family transcriptional regulator, anaerobic regulatory protein
MFHQIKAYYKKLSPLLTEKDWEFLQSKMQIQQLKKGELLVKSGAICRQVSFINKGMVRMFYIVDGKEITGGFIAENEYISEYESFLLQKPAIGNIEAIEDSEFINLGYDDVQLLYKTSPAFLEFGRKIAEYLYIMMSQQISKMMLTSPEERYLQLIENNPPYLQRVPQYMIASLIGITPEHLSRIRKKIAFGNNGH